MNGSARGLICVVLLGITTWAPLAHATGSDAAIAEDLFNDAKRLLEKGDTAHACPKFAESLRLDPTLGTRLNLAHCYEVAGKTASAWGEYKEVVSQANAVNDQKRVEAARQRLKVVEGKLSRVTLRSASSDGIALTLDGNALQAAVIGTPFPIDPGDHVIEVTAPRKKPYKNDFHVDAQSTSNVDIPALEEAAEDQSSAANGNSSNAPAFSASTKRTVGYIVGGAGIVSLGVGAYFGVRTLSLASDVKSECPTGPCSSQDGIDKNSSAHTDALVSDITIGIGIVAIAAGIYLVVTAKPARDSHSAFRFAPTTSPHGGGAALTGEF